MYDEIVKNYIDKKFNNSQSYDFYVLNNYFTKRSIYFKNELDAIRFMKFKFRGLKLVIYYLIILGILQPFLKKIQFKGENLSLIFVGGQIKAFDFVNKLVYSFPISKDLESEFIRDKRAHKELNNVNITTKVYSFDFKIPCLCEELASPYLGLEYERIFFNLNNMYSYFGLNKLYISKVLPRLVIDLKKNKINDNLIDLSLNKLNKIEYLLFSRVHGEFSINQILIDKKNNLLISDLDHFGRGCIIEDFTFFFLDNNYKSYYYIINRFYPKHVRDNLDYYLIYGILKELSMNRISLDNARSKLNTFL